MIPLRTSLVLLPLLLSSPSFALQILEAKDGDTVLGKISQKEVTRIGFERGRVRKVTGNPGEFALEKDEEKGHIFIRPMATDSTKPINLFVSSDRSTIALLLQPVDTPSDTIVIREGRDALNSPRTERSSVHVRSLKNLLLTMANDARSDDMNVREPGRTLTLWPEVRFVLEREWIGDGLVGEKFQLVNVGHADLHLSEQDLYKRGVMAVSVEQPHLRPGEATPLFVIRERHAHE